MNVPLFKLSGSPVGFSIGNMTINGSAPFNFAWIQNGLPLRDNGHFSSTQSSNLIATGILSSDAGNYQLVISNAFGVVTSAVAQVVVHCVNVNGTSPTPPYLTWTTAATDIQDAITAAAIGDVVLVTNGLYATGGISMDGVITNRVSVNKAILVQSVNGPNSTIIQGVWDPISTNGPGAIRCVWMTTNSILGGFTLCGGATRPLATGGAQAISGGGAWGPEINGAALMPVCTIANCVIISNAASDFGGGAYQVNLNYCTIATNAAVGTGSSGGYGGGAAYCNIKNSLITANSAFGSSSSSGGGVYDCNLKNCAVTRNNSINFGGGVDLGTLVNCSVTGNQVGNTSIGYGGGVANCTLINCIVYLNLDNALSYSSYSNSYSSTFSYSCTAPAASGTGNITSNPLLLAGGVHLSATSPCIGTGIESVVSGTDIDGQPWKTPPSMGCDEWQPAPVIAVQPNFLMGPPAYGLTCSVVVAGQAPFSCFWTQNGNPIQDDGHYSNSGTANLTINNFSPADAGTYQVVVTNSFGSTTSAVVQLTIHAVNVAGVNPISPYSTWTTAATNIQDAIEAASAGDIVLVTNGFYATGGEVVSGGLINRVALDKPILVTSVNGYSATVIQGAWSPASSYGTGPGAVRCAYVVDGAILNGFTLQNGSTLATGDYAGGPLESGGGIYCVSTNGLVSNCILSNNTAIYGGGIANGTLNNSLVYLNQATKGGGAYDAMLNNCTVANNYLMPGYSVSGAGIYGTYVYACRNCIVFNNVDYTSGSTDNYYPPGGAGEMFFYSCTSPTPSGTGNINVYPQFLDSFHIASSSPCRGAGNSAYAAGTDLDGEAWANPPSMGCDEVVLTNLVGPLSADVFAYSTSLVTNRFSNFWGRFTGRASTIIWSFGDGVTGTNGWSALHEWTNSGTYPVSFTVYNNDNPTGVSAMVWVQVQPLLAPQIQPAGIVGGAFQFQFPVQNANYTVQYTTNLSQPAWQTLQTFYTSYNPSNIIQVNDQSWTNGARFYRVVTQ